MNIRIKFVDAALYVTGPTLAPTLATLKAGTFEVIDWAIMLIAMLIAFTGSLAAYRSMKYAQSRFTLTPILDPPQQ